MNIYSILYQDAVVYKALSEQEALRVLATHGSLYTMHPDWSSVPLYVDNMFTVEELHVGRATLGSWEAVVTTKPVPLIKGKKQALPALAAQVERVARTRLLRNIRLAVQGFPVMRLPSRTGYRLKDTQLRLALHRVAGYELHTPHTVVYSMFDTVEGMQEVLSAALPSDYPLSYEDVFTRFGFGVRKQTTAIINPKLRTRESMLQ